MSIPVIFGLFVFGATVVYVCVRWGEPSEDKPVEYSRRGDAMRAGAEASRIQDEYRAEQVAVWQGKPSEPPVKYDATEQSIDEFIQGLLK